MKYRIAKAFLATSLFASLLLVTLLVSSSPAAGQESSALSLETHIPLPEEALAFHVDAEVIDASFVYDSNRSGGGGVPILTG
jgi:hypothetical protein